MKNREKLLQELCCFKMKYVINIELYKDEVITKEVYENTSNYLLERINNISEYLECGIA